MIASADPARIDPIDAAGKPDRLLADDEFERRFHVPRLARMLRMAERDLEKLGGRRRIATSPQRIVGFVLAAIIGQPFHDQPAVDLPERLPHGIARMLRQPFFHRGLHELIELGRIEFGGRTWAAQLFVHVLMKCGQHLVDGLPAFHIVGLKGDVVDRFDLQDPFQQISVRAAGVASNSVTLNVRDGENSARSHFRTAALESTPSAGPNRSRSCRSMVSSNPAKRFCATATLASPGARRGERTGRKLPQPRQPLVFPFQRLVHRHDAKLGRRERLLGLLHGTKFPALYGRYLPLRALLPLARVMRALTVTFLAFPLAARLLHFQQKRTGRKRLGRIVQAPDSSSTSVSSPG